MRHHTKDKGDIGLGFVIADLFSHGIQVALPMSEHLPFDLIAIAEQRKLARVSVKYRAAKRGKISLTYRSSWSDRHGVHIRHHDKTTYDAIAVYCPDTHECYYIQNAEVGKNFCLRIDNTKNSQEKKIRFASGYRDPRRLFSPRNSIG